MMDKIFLKTFGCKANQYDSQFIRESLGEKGYQFTEDSQQADVCIINTCTVTARSDNKVASFVKKCNQGGRKKQCIITGCAVSRKSHAFNSHQETIHVVDNFRKHTLASVLRNIKNGSMVRNHSTIDASGDHFEQVSINAQKISSFHNHDRVFVKIQDGCDRYCSYCIVPDVRGAPRSKKLMQVYNEVADLVKNGFVEVVLTGINLGLFGADLQRKNALVDLLRDISGIPGLKRIRLSSLEVDLISEELIEFLVLNEKMCHHLHIPLQSGSNRILAKMNRKYTKENFLNKIEAIKRKIKDFCFTTDVIVGFPGESEHDFNETIEVVKINEFSKVHVFPFSYREGTSVQSFLQERLSHTLVKERVKALVTVSQEVSCLLKQKYIGKKVDILVESKREKKSNFLQGMTIHYLRVLIDGPDSLCGKIISVKLLALRNDCLVGVVL
ncbi:tRNA (N(6)-L-threonylcarbamoyladenosine(37)-C(2))-methylthiotransferase MtaB [Chlamydiota bacterium]